MELPATNRPGVTILVDDEDAPLVSRHKWAIDAKGNARATIYLGGGRAAPKYAVVFLARLVMGSPPIGAPYVDHINRVKVDNRKANLRWATHGGNRVNSKASSTNGSRRRFIVTKILRDGRQRFGVAYKQRAYAWHDSVDAAVAWRDAFLPAIVGPFYPVGAL